MSGGWSAEHAPGDLIVPADFPFSVECKKSESWTLVSLLSGKHAWFFKWWVQCCSAAATAGKRPLLIFTKNHTPIFAAVQVVDFTSLTSKRLKASSLRLKVPEGYPFHEDVMVVTLVALKPILTSPVFLKMNEPDTPAV